MSILDLFSKRQKKLREEIPDVYQYEEIPQKLKVQIVHIWKDAFGDITLYNSKTQQTTKKIYNILCREYGMFSLKEDHYLNHNFNYLGGLIDFFIKNDEYEKDLDVIELTFKFIDSICREPLYIQYSRPEILANEAIDELNKRFLENGVGYQYESSYIVRMDSQLIHAEVIKPSLSFLQKPGFEGANEEFLKAHEHYRHERYKECLNECLKSLESTLKTICKKQNWTYAEKDTANTLIKICFEKELIPNYLQSEFSALRNILESSIPTIRNKESGHGQGTIITSVPSYFAAYMLHMTGSSIVFLVESYVEKSR